MQLDPGLLAAIIVNPADDLPRMLAADWFEEHGERDRAEFIWKQIERAKLSVRKKANCCGDGCIGFAFPDAEAGNGACESCRRLQVEKQALRVRERELFPATHRGPHPWVPQGIGMWPPWLDGDLLHWFTRGFIFHIVCTANQWAEHADTILAANPLESVTLTTMPEWPVFDRETVLRRRWPTIRFHFPPSVQVGPYYTGHHQLITQTQ